MRTVVSHYTKPSTTEYPNPWPQKARMKPWILFQLSKPGKQQLLCMGVAAVTGGGGNCYNEWGNHYNG